MGIKLKDVSTPMMEVEMPDGTVRRYDPFAVIRSLSPHIEGDVKYPVLIAAARKSFDLPEAITDYQTLFLIRELTKFVEESGAIKGLMPTPQS
jgi:hypothetical protein